MESMENVIQESRSRLVSFCGLYCGECKKFINKKCRGCEQNAKATWCKVRKCCIDNGYKTCADCAQLDDIKDCKMLNNFISKVFSLVFKTDRVASLKYIKEIGLEGYAKEMAEKKQVSIKK